MSSFRRAFYLAALCAALTALWVLLGPGRRRDAFDGSDGTDSDSGGASFDGGVHRTPPAFTHTQMNERNRTHEYFGEARRPRTADDRQRLVIGFPLWAAIAPPPASAAPAAPPPNFANMSDDALMAYLAARALEMNLNDPDDDGNGAGPHQNAEGLHHAGARATGPRPAVLPPLPMPASMSTLPAALAPLCKAAQHINVDAAGGFRDPALRVIVTPVAFGVDHDDTAGFSVRGSIWVSVEALRAAAAAAEEKGTQSGAGGDSRSPPRAPGPYDAFFTAEDEDRALRPFALRPSEDNSPRHPSHRVAASTEAGSGLRPNASFDMDAAIRRFVGPDGISCSLLVSGDLVTASPGAAGPIPSASAPSSRAASARGFSACSVAYVGGKLTDADAQQMPRVIRSRGKTHLGDGLGRVRAFEIVGFVPFTPPPAAVRPPLSAAVPPEPPQNHNRNMNIEIELRRISARYDAYDEQSPTVSHFLREPIFYDRSAAARRKQRETIVTLPLLPLQVAEHGAQTATAADFVCDLVPQWPRTRGPTWLFPASVAWVQRTVTAGPATSKSASIWGAHPAPRASIAAVGPGSDQASRVGAFLDPTVVARAVLQDPLLPVPPATAPVSVNNLPHALTGSWSATEIVTTPLRLLAVAIPLPAPTAAGAFAMAEIVNGSGAGRSRGLGPMLYVGGAAITDASRQLGVALTLDNTHALLRLSMSAVAKSDAHDSGLGELAAKLDPAVVDLILLHMEATRRRAFAAVANQAGKGDPSPSFTDAFATVNELDLKLAAWTTLVQPHASLLPPQQVARVAMGGGNLPQPQVGAACAGAAAVSRAELPPVYFADPPVVVADAGPEAATAGSAAEVHDGAAAAAAAAALDMQQRWSTPSYKYTDKASTYFSIRNVRHTGARGGRSAPHRRPNHYGSAHLALPSVSQMPGAALWRCAVAFGKKSASDDARATECRTPAMKTDHHSGGGNEGGPSAAILRFEDAEVEIVDSLKIIFIGDSQPRTMFRHLAAILTHTSPVFAKGGNASASGILLLPPEEEAAFFASRLKTQPPPRRPAAIKVTVSYIWDPYLEGLSANENGRLDAMFSPSPAAGAAHIGKRTLQAKDPFFTDADLIVLSIGPWPASFGQWTMRNLSDRAAAVGAQIRRAAQRTAGLYQGRTMQTRPRHVLWLGAVAWPKPRDMPGFRITNERLGLFSQAACTSMELGLTGREETYGYAGRMGRVKDWHSAGDPIQHNLQCAATHHSLRFTCLDALQLTLPVRRFHRGDGMHYDARVLHPLLDAVLWAGCSASPPVEIQTTA